MAKSYTVHITQAAEKDLINIVDYLNLGLGSPSAAKKLVNDIETLVSTLESQPYAHAKVRDEILALAGYHWASVSSYMAFYTINENDAEVTIERILHSRQNWKSIV